MEPVAEAPAGVEVVRRAHAGGPSYLFVINHTGDDAVVTVPDGESVPVPAGGVRIVREPDG
nr:hypothetical protein GCM10020093_036280 [Planobispora longispora]